MRTNITLAVLTISSFFAPIQIMVIVLMFIIFVDTIVKLVSLRKIAKESNRKYREVFKSRILRQGYIYKSLGYYIAAGVVFPLDYYALTPFLNGLLEFTGFSFVISVPAILTNILLGIFSLIELASINENWFDITGNNILSKTFDTVKKLRKGLKDASDTYKDIKN
jgi:hypothetical protein